MERFPFHLLPNEILPSIFRHLPQRDVRTYRLVSRKWAEALLRHMYYSVTIVSAIKCQQLLDVIRDHPTRPKYIHELIILQPETPWLLDRYELHTKLLNMMRMAPNLDVFAYDAHPRGPGSFSCDPLYLPVLFFPQVGAIIGHRMTSLYVTEDFLPQQCDGPWWETGLRPETRDELTTKFMATLPNLIRCAMLVTSSWVRLTGPFVMQRLPPSCKQVVIDFPPDHQETMRQMFSVVPDFVEHVQIMGTLWADGAVIEITKNMSSRGRTIIITSPQSDANEQARLEEMLDQYEQSLDSCRQGAALVVNGPGDEYHHRLVECSGRSGRFMHVEKVIRKQERVFEFN